MGKIGTKSNRKACELGACAHSASAAVVCRPGIFFPGQRPSPQCTISAAFTVFLRVASSVEVPMGFLGSRRSHTVMPASLLFGFFGFTGSWFCLVTGPLSFVGR